jgi:hypothetical protein
VVPRVHLRDNGDTRFLRFHELFPGPTPERQVPTLYLSVRRDGCVLLHIRRGGVSSEILSNWLFAEYLGFIIEKHVEFGSGAIQG